jgi:hypothetical protein
MSKKPRPTNPEIERHYFEMFRTVFPLPAGTVTYGDKPDVTIIGSRTIGIEITNFYVADGTSSDSEQVQRNLRKVVVERAQKLHIKAGGQNVEITFSFDKANPIRDITALAQKIAALGQRIESHDNGQVRKEEFEDIPELDFVYLYARQLQDPNEPDPEFPKGQPDPRIDFDGYCSYNNRRDIRAAERGIYRLLPFPARWRVGQAHSPGLMNIDRLTQIVREKEAKANDYACCHAYWLLIVVDFINAAQEQEIRVDGVTVHSDTFERIIVYKPHFEHIVEVGQCSA